MSATNEQRAGVSNSYKISRVKAVLAQMKDLSRKRPKKNVRQGQERKTARPEIS